MIVRLRARARGQRPSDRGGRGRHWAWAVLAGGRRRGYGGLLSSSGRFLQLAGAREARRAKLRFEGARCSPEARDRAVWACVPDAAPTRPGRGPACRGARPVADRGGRLEGGTACYRACPMDYKSRFSAVSCRGAWRSGEPRGRRGPFFGRGRVLQPARRPFLVEGMRCVGRARPKPRKACTQGGSPAGADRRGVTPTVPPQCPP